VRKQVLVTGGAGFLGPAHDPFNLVGRKAREKPDNMVLRGITLERLGDRDQLHKQLDRFRRDADVKAQMESIDAYTEQALGILTDSKLGDALDLSKEDPRVVKRYGTGDDVKRIDGNGAPRVPQSFLTARRLVEAGARFVTVNYSKWDWHGGPNNDIFKREREDFPVLDKAITALVDDLHQRGLDKDVSVLVWGEFGRTPMRENRGGRYGKYVGRDHHPRCFSVWMAGGGVKPGITYGQTDDYAYNIVDKDGNTLKPQPTKEKWTPGTMHIHDLNATILHLLGIDHTKLTYRYQGRDFRLTDVHGHVIHDLIA